MWDRLDSQEVGLEAAILERVRNSSLVEWSCADNVVGLKHTAETAAMVASFCGVWLLGRGASCTCGSSIVRRCGVCASENAGMSNELVGENPTRRMTKGSWVKFVFPG